MYQAYATIELFIDFSNFWLGGWETFIKNNWNKILIMTCTLSVYYLSVHFVGCVVAKSKMLNLEHSPSIKSFLNWTANNLLRLEVFFSGRYYIEGLKLKYNFKFLLKWIGDQDFLKKLILFLLTTSDEWSWWKCNFENKFHDKQAVGPLFECSACLKHVFLRFDFKFISNDNDRCWL